MGSLTLEPTQNQLEERKVRHTTKTCRQKEGRGMNKKEEAPRTHYSLNINKLTTFRFLIKTKRTEKQRNNEGGNPKSDFRKNMS